MIINKYKIKELNLSEYNPRKISSKQLIDLKKSITKYGIVDPIIINKNPERLNIVIGGHQRIRACSELNITEIECVELNLSLEKEKELNVRLNKNSGEFDFHELIKNFSKQEAIEFGFDIKEIEKGLNREALNIAKSIKENNYREERKQEYLKKWGVKKNDLWQAGDHKLICGDSLDPETYERLLGVEKCQMMFTDPPYGVDYNDTIGGFKPIENDELKDKGLYNFLNKFLLASVSRIENNGSFYIWHATRTRRMFEDAFISNKLKELSYIIWVKDTASVNYFYYRMQHEPCFFMCKEGQSPLYYGGPEESMVWELNPTEEGDIKRINLGNGIKLITDTDQLCLVRNVSKKIKEVQVKTNDKILLENDLTNDVWYIRRDPAIQYLHPTQKPVELAVKAINNSSRVLDSVLDPFSGSGFTLLACEKLNRKARCIELDPGYCATILERYFQMTGIKPIRIE